MRTAETNSTISALIYLPESVVSFRYFGISIGILTIFAGSIGNLLTILVYFTRKTLQTTFNRFVVNLSVVDFVTASLMLPFNVSGYVQQKWPFGNDSFTARLQAFFYFSCGYTSTVFLVAITVNRFLGVFFPTKYETIFNKKRTSVILIMCWTYAPVFLVSFMLGTDSKCTNNINQALTGFHSQQLLCTFICLPDDGWAIYMQFVRIMFQFLPLAIMVVAYGAILIKVRNNSKTLLKQLDKAFEEHAPSVGTKTAEFEPSRLLATPRTKPKPSATEAREHNPLIQIQVSNFRKAQHARRMLLISIVICAAFMITFLPSFIINIIPNKYQLDTRWHMAASNLSWLNSALNPIIYAILNPKFRKEYHGLIERGGCQLRQLFVLRTSILLWLNCTKEDTV